MKIPDFKTAIAPDGEKIEIPQETPTTVSTLTDATRHSAPSDWHIVYVGVGELEARHTRTGEYFRGSNVDFEEHLK